MKVFAGVEKLEDFDGHKLVSFIYDAKSGLKGYITIHRGNHKIPAFGATRIWNYESSYDSLVDTLRLSKTMSYKAALAGLKCGGAKAAIMADSSRINNRSKLLSAYAAKVNLLRGYFITGADVGVERQDVVTMRRYSPYFVGVRLDPVKFTGLGIFYSIQSCFKEEYGNDDITGRSFAIQGLGKVGQELLKLIYPNAGKIYVCDIDRSKVREVKKKYPKINVVGENAIYQKKVDVYSPNALSSCLNKNNVNKIAARVIVGGANCQLENDIIGEKLHARGILYAPDYVVNAGGLICVFDEYENGRHKAGRVLKKVARIKNTLELILAQSRKKRRPPFLIANKMAEKKFNHLT